MQVKTVIGISAHGSGPASVSSGKKTKVVIDALRLRQLTDQLSELVEELDDIKEDLYEMLEEMEDSGGGDYADDEEGTPYELMDNVCSAVDSAYMELNEALDEMEGLL